MKKVLFISGCYGDTQRYRVFNQIEQLEEKEIEVLERYFADYDIVTIINENIDLIIMHRVPYTDGIGYLIKEANSRSIPTIFDVDDLVFDKEFSKYSDGINYLDSNEKELYFEGIERYKKTIELCDGAVVTTDFLAECIAKYNSNVAINRNVISKKLQEISELENGKNHEKASSVRIGYFSGSKTHNKDFLEAKDGLLRILEKYDNTELVIGGLLDLPKEFDCYANRITRIPLVNWSELPKYIKSVDINIAPLEINNPFCKAKSELKYFEAGILKIPTVASRIDAFEYAIDDGVNGFLASNSQEWYQKIEELVVNLDLRNKIGAAAYVHVLNNYTVISRADEYIRTLSFISSRDNNMKVCNYPSLIINFLIPQPFKGSGGHTTILRMAKYLYSKGHEVNMYVQYGENFDMKSDKAISEFIDQNFFYTGANYYREDVRFKNSDVFIATSWPTAYRVNSVDNCKEKFYFIQDFEPFFYPMSSEYKLAENSYKMKLHGITIGKWLTKKIRNDYGMECDYIDFSVDKDIYINENEKRLNNRTKIIFYARNSTPRRGVELGLQALELIEQRYGEYIEIILFGGDKDLKVNFRHRNVGVLTVNELSELYREADIGLVLSLTNCSLLPLELMASRCSVVDIEEETIEGVIKDNFNGLLAKADPIDIANKISQLIDNPEIRYSLQDNGFNFTKDLSWDNSGSQFENILISKCLFNENFPRIREIKDTSDENIVKPHSPLIYGVVYGIEIRVSLNNFSRVDLYFGNFNRVNKGNLIFHLKKSVDSVNDIVTKKVELGFIEDNSWFSFSFDPIINSKDQVYYIYIESNVDEFNAVTVYGNGNGHNLFINHISYEGSLCYKSYCTNQGHFIYDTIYDRDNTSIREKHMNLDELSINDIAGILKQKINNTGISEYEIREIRSKLNEVEVKIIRLTNSYPAMMYKKTKKLLGNKFIRRLLRR